jgi:NAD(P)-dependent dehydrogenase (short-subunit alcohol dehydrogenase family)
LNDDQKNCSIARIALHYRPKGDLILRLQNRRLVVTGGASGIGRSRVEVFLREGANVAIFDIDAAGMRPLAQEGRCWAIDCDVRDEGSVSRAMASAAEAMGGVDGVVNSAGIASGVPFEETDFALWRAQIETNLNGTFLVCKAATPLLLKAGGGTIVNLASAQALLPTGSSASYAASKGGVVAFSKNISFELAAKGIRVNVVCPGTTETPMVQELMVKTPEAIQRTLGGVPMGRLAQPAEVSDLIVFLTGPESAFITGTAIPCDGGRTRH